MNMIGHQAIGINAYTKSLLQFAQVREVILKISCVSENNLPIVASLYDMVGVVGQYNASYSGHTSSYVLVVMRKA
ncbi:hypothetical protein D3C72_1749770 [compost metagenome]